MRISKVFSDISDVLATNELCSSCVLLFFILQLNSVADCDRFSHTSPDLYRSARLHAVVTFETNDMPYGHK